MSEPDARLQMIQDQVSSKIHWDAPDAEVLEWLEEKHRITGDDADRMLRIGHQKRAKAIRERAFLGMIFSLAGALFCAFLFWLKTEGVDAGRFAVVGTFIASVAWFGRSLLKFVSGKTTETIDP